MDVKLHIYDRGDPDVGIFPNEMDVSFNWDMGTIDDDERKALREAFCRFAKDQLGFGYPRVFASFGDECPECGKILVNGRCYNKGCMDYNPDAKIEVIKND